MAAREDSLAPAGTTAQRWVRAEPTFGEGRVLVAGQTVVVTAAVAKGEAERLMQKRKEQERASRAADRRNLHLLEVRAGKEWAGVSEEKREDGRRGKERRGWIGQAGVSQLKLVLHPVGDSIGQISMASVLAERSAPLRLLSGGSH